MLDKTLAVIGCGNMGGALVRGLSPHCVDRRMIVAFDCDEEKSRALADACGIQIAADAMSAVSSAEVVIFAVKPTLLPRVLSTVQQGLSARAHNPLLVSVAAGVPLQIFFDVLGAEVRCSRVMPNLACGIGCGVAAVFAREQEYASETAELFSHLGFVVRLAKEEEMDTVTALSGSGPAFVMTFIEALADGAVKLGLDRKIAQVIAAQTVIGAGRLLVDSEEHPAVLRDRVASPGGTTIAGLHVLEKGAFRSTVISALEASRKRAEEMRSLNAAKDC